MPVRGTVPGRFRPRSSFRSRGSGATLAFRLVPARIAQGPGIQPHVHALTEDSPMTTHLARIGGSWAAMAAFTGAFALAGAGAGGPAAQRPCYTGEGKL